MKGIRISIVLFIILIAIFVATRHTSIVARDYGEVVLRMGQSVKFTGGLIITPQEVTEDSRCATGVQCIWAGTLKVRTLIEIGGDPSAPTIELGESVKYGDYDIKLISVGPSAVAGKEISKDEYKLTFDIEKNITTTPTPITTSKCYVGGCSAQICSDQPDAVSTCEYTAAYACYQGAKCERQASGACGWTETPELKMCLSNAK